MPRLKTHFFIKVWISLRKVKLVYDRDTSFLEVNGRRGNELWDLVHASSGKDENTNKQYTIEITDTDDAD